MKSIRRMLAVMLVLVMALCMTVAGAETDRTDLAREMLGMINSFRTGGNAWYWNSDNQTVTQETGLSGLAYDYQLEEVAKIRAAEIAVRFSHTRPDGSKWSTAFPAGNYYRGENIACGQTSAQEAFDSFREEDEDYAGQGHRRNMLQKHFTRVGLAAVEVNGTIYWVQEFASGSVQGSSGGSSSSGAAASDSAQAGWVRDGGKYYYRNGDGSWAKGWIQDGGDWYYLDGKGAMQTGWIKDGGNWYYMDPSGAMQTGWIEDGDCWYYAGENGKLKTGWQEIENDWYYFKKDGAMVTGSLKIDGHTEYFNADGVWQDNEISDYETPLGTSPLLTLFGKLLQQVQKTLNSFFGIE